MLGSFKCKTPTPLWLNLFLSILGFFGAIVNGIVSLILFLDGSLLIYRNEIDACVLIVCPANLLKLFFYF